MNILVACGDDAALGSIELAMKTKGFRAYGVDEGAEAVDLAKIYDYDALVLSDTQDLTAIDMTKSIRLARVRTPILILSRASHVENVVHGLDTGADDFLAAPFHHDELIARLHALVRRSKGHAESKIELGQGVILNIDSKTATVDGAPLHLTGKEFLMLELLALRIGQVQSKESFLNALYGGMDEPEIKIVDVFMCKIRKKLAALGVPDLIVTVWGRGYMIAKPGQSLSDGASITSEIRALAGHTTGGISERGVRRLVG